MLFSRAKVQVDKACLVFLYCSGLVALARWSLRRAGPRLIILNYHRATDCDLRSHLVYLRRHYRMLPLEQALNELYAPIRGRPETQDRRTLLAVTFDDGYRDNYTHAAALACELHVPLTIFLIPGYIDSERRFWWDEAKHLPHDTRVREVELGGHLYHPDREDDRQALADFIYACAYHAASVCAREAFLESARRALVIRSSATAGDDPSRPLRWAEVRDMEASGWVSFGAHTMHHPVLSLLCEPDEVRREIGESRTELERHLGHPVHTFAYPFGRPEHFGEVGCHAVREAGFLCAVTTIHGFNTPETPPHLLRRIPVGHNRHWLVLAADVAGLWPLRPLVRRAARRFRLGRQPRPPRQAGYGSRREGRA